VRAGLQVTPLPAPGTYARHNAVDIPALLPDGSISELSVSATLRARGQIRDVSDDALRRLAELEQRSEEWLEREPERTALDREAERADRESVREADRAAERAEEGAK
jgi:NADH-quinone oxidoreductase subunit J